MVQPTLIAVSPVPLAVTWLLTYLLHSTVILGVVWLVTRSGWLSAPRHRASLWKIGALAGLLTASVQVGLASWSPVTPGKPGSAAEGLWGAPRLTWSARLEGRTGRPVNIRQAASVRAGEPACEAALTRHIQEARVRLEAPAGPVPSVREPEALLDPCGGTAPARWPRLLLGLWALGALIGCGTLLRRRARLNRAMDPSAAMPVDIAPLLERVEERAGLQSPLRLVDAGGLGSPAALTGGRIALPSRAIEGLEEGELAAVLAHEVGHVVRRDPAWLRGLSILGAILWLQPLNRVARQGFQLASEFLADDWAIHCTGSRLPLARALEKVSRMALDYPSPRCVVTMARPESPIVERVRAILEKPIAESPRVFSPGSALLLLPALLLPPVSVSRPEAVQVLVVREVREESAGNPSPTESASPSDRIEVRVYALPESPRG